MGQTKSLLSIFPTSVAQIVDDSFALALRKPILKLFARLLPLALLFAAFAVLLTLPTQRSWQPLGTMSGDLATSFATFAWMAVWSIPLWLLQALVELAMISAAAEAWRGQSEQFAPKLKTVSFSLVIRLIAINIIIGIASMFLLLLFVVPGVIYIVNRLPVTVILVLENRSARATIARSKALMTQHSTKGWKTSPGIRISGLFLLIFLPSLLISFLNPQALPIAKDLLTPAPLALLIAVHFMTMLITVFRTLMITGFYFDLIERFEGPGLLASLAALTAAEKTK